MGVSPRAALPQRVRPSARPGCSSFAEAAPQLAAQYSVPHLFRNDLFACLGYKREDYRQVPQRMVSEFAVGASAARHPAPASRMAQRAV